MRVCITRLHTFLICTFHLPIVALRPQKSPYLPLALLLPVAHEISASLKALSIKNTLCSLLALCQTLSTFYFLMMLHHFVHVDTSWFL